MKIAKNNIDPIFTARADILKNYFLVEDDFDFIGNDATDVTTRRNLLFFYGVNRINYKIYRNALIDISIPIWNTLSDSEKRDLIYDRVFPSNLTEQDLITIVGSESEYLTIKSTNSSFEEIETVENFNQVFSADTQTNLNNKLEKAEFTGFTNSFNQYSGDTDTRITSIELGLSGDTLESSVFYAGKASSQSLSTSDVTISGWDTPTQLSDSYAFNITTGVLTFLEDGLYTVTFYATTENTAGGDRTDSTTSIEIDDGSGYSLLPNSTAFYYNRDNTEGRTNASVTITDFFSGNTTLRVRGRINSGGSSISILGGSIGLNIIKEEIGRYNVIFTGETDNFVNQSQFISYSGETDSRFDLLELQTVDTGIYAASRTNSSGTQLDGFGLSVVRTNNGIYDYTFAAPVAGSNYIVLGQPFFRFNDTNVVVSNVSPSGFRITTGDGDNGGGDDVPTDTDHAVAVFGVPVSATTTQPVVSSGTFNTVVDALSASTDNRLIINDFNTYSGDTDTRLNGIDNNIDFISGQTDTKLATTNFNTYTAETNTFLNSFYTERVTRQNTTSATFQNTLSLNIQSDGSTYEIIFNCLYGNNGAGGVTAVRFNIDGTRVHSNENIGAQSGQVGGGPVAGVTVAQTKTATLVKKQVLASGTRTLTIEFNRPSGVGTSYIDYASITVKKILT